MAAELSTLQWICCGQAISSEKGVGKLLRRGEREEKEKKERKRNRRKFERGKKRKKEGENITKK